MVRSRPNAAVLYKPFSTETQKHISEQLVFNKIIRHLAPCLIVIIGTHFSQPKKRMAFSYYSLIAKHSKNLEASF